MIRWTDQMRNLPKYAVIAACWAIAVLATITAPGSAAAASKWTLRQLPPTARKSGGETYEYYPSLHGVSCPTESLCVAAGGSPDTLAFSQAPSGGLAQWHVVNLPYPVGPGRSCVAGQGDCHKPIGGLNAISCPSQNLCVAVTEEGYLYVSTEPTAGAGAWSPTVLSEGQSIHLTAVSCPSSFLCVAVSGGPGISEGKVFTSTNPTSGEWQVTQLASSLNFRGVFCGTPSLCVAVGGEGQIVVSTDPTGGASAWPEVGAPGGTDGLRGIDCVAALLCAAGSAAGNILTSSDPAGSGASWHEAYAGRPQRITGLSCPRVNRCVAVDDNGDVFTSSDPTGGPGSWNFENLVPFENPGQPLNGLFSASCASASICALVGSDGRIFTSTEPFAVPTETPGGQPGHRAARRRPRTILRFAAGFKHATRSPRRHVRARFRFYSPTGVKGFECRRDRGRYRSCHSPLAYWAAAGRHVLRVRAIGPTGLRGPAAIKRFHVTLRG